MGMMLQKQIYLLISIFSCSCRFCLIFCCNLQKITRVFASVRSYMICVRVIVVVPGQQQNPILLCGLRTIEKVVESTESPPPSPMLQYLECLDSRPLCLPAEQMGHPTCSLTGTVPVNKEHSKITQLILSVPQYWQQKHASMGRLACLE